MLDAEQRALLGGVFLQRRRFLHLLGPDLVERGCHLGRYTLVYEYTEIVGQKDHQQHRRGHDRADRAGQEGREVAVRQHQAAAQAFVEDVAQHDAEHQRHALAGLGRDAAIAQFAGTREDVVIGIRFIDNQRHLSRQAVDRPLQRRGAFDRLLDIADGGTEPA